jgi:DNA (cytosine-5)-methyltransferase 3A
MKVLSLFDGISCGMLALQRAGIPVERYDAFEIDKYAVQVSEKNYPQIVHHGDVFEGDFTQFKGYDLLLGGSPCTYWSIAKQGREVTPDGIGGKLFLQYVRALRESGCKYFLYENNYSIHKDIKAFISQQLGVEPIMINSALVSAQHRKRCYWTNIPNVTQPGDKGIMLADVLENAVPWQDKSYCMTSTYNGAVLYNTLERKQRTMVAIPINTVGGKSHTIPATYYKAGEKPFSPYGSEMAKQRVAIPISTYNDEGEKSRTVMAGYYKYGEATLIKNKGFKGGATAVADPVGAAQRGRYIQSGNRSTKAEGGTEQFIEVRKDNKSNCLTTVQKDSLVCEPLRVGTVEGKSQSREWRIYSVKGKSISICGCAGGGGAKTGLYKIDLPDGDYIIRKLTPVEAERLQTLPDNYTAGISNTQRYKCIGNGWTVDVIAHILRYMRGDNDVDKNRR